MSESNYDLIIKGGIEGQHVERIQTRNNDLAHDIILTLYARYSLIYASQIGREG